MAIEHLAEPRALDCNALPDDTRAEFDRNVEHWLMVFAMTEPEAVADHLAAAEELGRELTLEEAKALLLRQ